MSSANMSSGTLTIDRADAVVKAMEKALDDLLSAQGNSVAVTRAEVNLLVKIEAARDLLELALRSSKQREALKEVFGGDCRRIELMRAILEESFFSEMNEGDPRPAACLRACESVESVLEDLGLGEALRKAREERHMRKATTAPVEASPEEPKPDVERTSAPPPELRGHLWKKSPGLLGSFQQRQVEIKEARLSWWSAGTVLDGTAPAPKGVIDFRENPVLVDPMKENPGRFVLRPKHGEWRSGGFTGADRGREFVFDASSSEVDTSEWLEAIQNHIRYGEGKYQNPQISFRW